MVLLPANEIIVERVPVVAEVSAYTASPDETDSSPETTACNTRTRIGIIANNSLPCFSKVEIDGKIYSVEDKMNRRYGKNHFDILMETKQEAKKFGRQIKEVKIL